MKKYIYMAVAAVAVLSSCSGESASEEMKVSGGKVETFTATIDGEGTRTTLGTGDKANKVLWSSGDQISVNGSLYSTTSTSTTAEFTRVDGQGIATVDANNKFKAYYPASMYSNGLPATYTYEAGKFNMPMYAESEGRNLTFQNICGVLAIKVTSAEMSKVTSITVTSDKAISGTCTINGDGSTTKYYATATGNKTVTLNCGTDGVAPTEEGTVFYLPLPVLSSATTLYITVNGDVATTKASSYNPFIYTQSMKATNVTIARNTIYAVDFKTSLAKFSVSASTTVNFTNGNLYWDGSAFKFEDSQTAYPTSWNAAHVGHFYWTVAIKNSYCKDYPTLTTKSTDSPWFASNVTVNGTSGLRALTGGSSGQYNYLITTRGTTLRKNGVTVGSATDCLIIAPDNFVGTLKSNYTEAELKAFGLVCLPAAGNRSSSSLSNGGKYGYFWSTTLNSRNRVYCLYFGNGNVVNPIYSSNGNRSNGSALRLVK